MKYFIDTEFLEGTQDKTIFGIKYGQTKPTIDLISIGIVAEDGREYYAISKDFNLKEAWNRFDLKLERPEDSSQRKFKSYWIRENVLKPIYDDLCVKRSTYEKMHHWELAEPFSYKSMKYLINRYGKTNKQIAQEIIHFTNGIYTKDAIGNWEEIKDKLKPKFYGYFADYDWVAFCWLFGRMMDLPKCFPMYCVDLKQELDRITNILPKELFRKLECESCEHNVLEYLEKTGRSFELDFRLKMLKEKHPNYPKKTNEHNALDDARWNRDLYKFLKSL